MWFLAVFYSSQIFPCSYICYTVFIRVEAYSNISILQFWQWLTWNISIFEHKHELFFWAAAKKQTTQNAVLIWKSTKRNTTHCCLLRRLYIEQEGYIKLFYIVCKRNLQNSPYSKDQIFFREQKSLTWITSIFEYKHYLINSRTKNVWLLP